MLCKQTITNVSLKKKIGKSNVPTRAKSSHHNWSQRAMTCYSSGVVGKKGANNLALDDKQNSFQTGVSWVAVLTWAAKKTLANYHVKCYYHVMLCFLRIHGYCTRQIYIGKVRSHTLTFTTATVSRVTAPNISGFYRVDLVFALNSRFFDKTSARRWGICQLF